MSMGLQILQGPWTLEQLIAEYLQLKHLLDMQKLEPLIDNSQLVQDIASIKQRIDDFKQEDTTLNIKADTTSAKSSLDELKEQYDKLKRFIDEWKLQSDTGYMEWQLSGIKKQIDVLKKDATPLEIKADTAPVDKDLTRLKNTVTDSNHIVNPNTTEVDEALNRLRNSNTYSTHTIYVQQVQTNALGGLIGARLAGGGAPNWGSAKQAAGMVHGPGDETSDSIPAMLSRGEFVVRAAAVRKWGADFMHAINAGILPSISIPQYAAGGLVAGNANAAAQGSHDTVTIDLRIGQKSHQVASNRQTAMALAESLRELSRAL